MQPNKKQRRWLKKHLPEGVKVLDVVPRAYCAVKSTVGCASFAMPHIDLRKHLTTSGNAKCNSGVVIYAGDANRCIYDVCQGDWVTLVYGTTRDTGLWYCVPKPMPWNTFKER
ncbi:MAG: hypothetical protein DRJ03_02050 [Chloroflexi bacterium]|nr:MAG: hypothetical protein DRJ03_02050 [Chloroflexota bacterium]